MELYDFADPESTISKRYEDSLRVALKYGVKITYCGSIDDQLVSMEASTCPSNVQIQIDLFPVLDFLNGKPSVYLSRSICGRSHTCSEFVRIAPLQTRPYTNNTSIAAFPILSVLPSSCVTLVYLIMASFVNCQRRLRAVFTLEKAILSCMVMRESMSK